MKKKSASGIMLTLLLTGMLSITHGTIPTVTASEPPVEIGFRQFPQAGKFYTLAGRSVGWEIIGGENVTTWHSEEIHKWSIQDVVDDVAFVNRTFVDANIRPQTGWNYIDTYDFDYEIALDRTILSARWKIMSFDASGFRGSDQSSLDEDVGEHTWGWFPTNLFIGAFVLVTWTFDRRFLGDTLYEVIGDDVIQVLGEKQDCWVLRLPPVVTIDGTQARAETYWVDKDTGIPLKFYTKGWALDLSFGWAGEDVLVNTNVNLGPESTQPPSPTYTLNVPTTPGFPEAGKFWSWYFLDEGWYLSRRANVTYYEDGLLIRWVVEVTDDEALVYKIFWGDYLVGSAGIRELENVEILYTVYRARTTTREIIEAVSSTVYVVDMTSLSYQGPWDWTAQLADDVGEETWCWLPTDLYIGATVDITWSFDRPWKPYEATYTVVGESTVDALGEPQASWTVYLPPTASADGTRNYLDTWYSDKDTGVPLSSFMKGWAVDGSTAWVQNVWLIDTNIDLGLPELGITATIDVHPETLNLKNRGKWISAYIELPEGYDVYDIDVSSILLNETISAEQEPTAIGDFDGDTIPDLMVKVSRAKILSYIRGIIDFSALRFARVTLTITGQLKDGTPFQGSDAIKIIFGMPRPIQWI